MSNLWNEIHKIPTVVNLQTAILKPWIIKYAILVHY